MPENQEDMRSPAPELRQRLAAEIAAGRTVSMSAAEMADPELRRQLPGLLAELTGAGSGTMAPGLHVDGYTVLGAIGHGGMSTVFLARQDTLGRYVALKVASWSGADRKKRDRLVNEARAMARVAHPNIVAIHDIVDVGDTVAIAMEWIDGLSLEALLRALPEQVSADDMALVRERLGTPTAAAANFDASSVRYFVQVLRDIARALHRVHEAGMLHLDVKPSNVLVRRDGTALLSDFGVVREIETEATNTRSFAGTPIYCAPEQLRRNDRSFGPHTDVYGLGITLYEMLARRQPLKGQDLTRLVINVEKGRIPALSRQISIAKDLETIVQKAMAPEPRYRYATAAALADDLQAFLEGRPVAARPLSRLQRAQRWARLEPWKAALLAVLVVTLPVVAFLGVKLVLGMHHITEGQRRERRQQANVLKQLAYQQRFLATVDQDHTAGLLRQAMKLDPSDTSLACLASLMLDNDYADVPPLLAAHADAVARSLGLQLLLKKANERRAYFDAAEVAQLAASSQAIDWYVLALDRAIWAEDASSESAYEQAVFHIDAAAIGQEPDPLLMGLRAWESSMAGLRDVRDATCRAMHQLWPDSGEVLRWDCMSHELEAPEVAAATAESWVARDPRCTAAWEMWIGCVLRQGKYVEGLELAERARAVPVSSPLLDNLYLNLLKANHRDDEARQILTSSPGKRSFRQRLRLAQLDGKDAALRFCREELKTSHLPASTLEGIMLEGIGADDPDLVGLAFERWRREHPGRRRMFLYELQRRFKMRDMQGAAAMAREVTTPRRRIDIDAPVLCIVFATTNDWPEMARVANTWLQYGKGANIAQASFYAGLAASRLGDSTAAAQHLAVATTAAPAGKPTAWYPSALLENAWLRAAPSSPAPLRDPELARLLLSRFEAANALLQKPRCDSWVKAVAAEVLFANGDVEDAVATARAGLAAPGGTGTAAPENCREILDRALERYRR